MVPKKLSGEINIFGNCRRYGLALWQCPQFLFLMMGFFIMIASLSAYYIATRFIGDPQLAALLVLFLTAALLTIAVLVVRSFERLAEANRMKTEFVSIVSHQLRAPLSNEKWSIELLLSGKIGPIEEEQLEYFKILKENNDRMRELINDLLTVSRIEQGRLPIVKANVSLKELIEKQLQRIRPFASASNIEILANLSGDKLEVYGDKPQITTVLENLLDNAIRYSKEKGKILVSAEKKGKFIFFEVKDHGVGIPEEERQNIFKKFFRSENALKRQTQGSGLGLYIAKAIIEDSGGKIGFSSRESVGSSFWFTLPVDGQVKKNK